MVVGNGSFTSNNIRKKRKTPVCLFDIDMSEILTCVLPYYDHVVMLNIVGNAIELISTLEMLGIIL